MSVATLFLRLEGPMQAWGVSSQWNIRETGREPSKSGVVGMICCALGLRRDNPELMHWLKKLNALSMGVRVDRQGTILNDYHTVGAKYGILAANGKIKYTESSGEIETVLSQRFYLYDASFLVALQGDEKVLTDVRAALNAPHWPLFLGRKCCVPSLPVVERFGPDEPQPPAEFESLDKALAFPKWMHRGDEIPPKRLRIVIESNASVTSAMQSHDILLRLFPARYGTRWIEAGFVEARRVDPPRFGYTSPERKSPYGENWSAKRKERLEKDQHQCVVCAWAAAKYQEVHHKSYAHAGDEFVETELCTLCAHCHAAVTQLEYEHGMFTDRIDPTSDAWCERVLQRRNAILGYRVKGGKPCSIRS